MPLTTPSILEHSRDLPGGYAMSASQVSKVLLNSQFLGNDKLTAHLIASKTGAREGRRAKETGEEAGKGISKPLNAARCIALGCL